MKKLSIVLLCLVTALSYAQIGIRNARGQNCTNNLKQVGLGLAIFMDDNGNRLPAKLDDAKSYVPASVCICPASRKPFIYLGSLRGNNNNAAIPVVMDRIGNHNGQINVLMKDGHVATIRHNAKNYQGLLPYFKGLSAQQKAELAKILKRLDTGR